MIKKTMVWLLGLVMSLATGLAFANATAFSITGTVTAQTGTAAARPVREGDTVRAGDTIATGAGSSAVLKFADGQIAALSANSRMTITAFEYNEQAKTGNIALQLLSGGMRAITGLIGRFQPDKVTYRAATATIGIRGTDVNIATVGGNAVVTVTDGAISFTFGGQTITLPAGQGVHAQADGTFSQGQIATITQQLQGTALGQQLLNSISGTNALTAAINAAAAGTAGTVTTTPGSGTATFTPGGTGGAGTGGGAPGSGS